MKRRAFITLLGGAAASWPLGALAQQEGHVARVGVIGPSLDRPGIRAAFPHFLTDLRKLGFAEGRNLQVEFRADSGSAPQLAAAVSELIAWKADVLFLWGSEDTVAVVAAARPSVPIVLAAINFDPVAKGYVQSLARPGGNVTGLISRWLEITAKQVELLQEAFPDRKRLGVLWDARSGGQFEAAAREAKARQLSLHSIKLEQPPYDFAAAFQALSQSGVQMLIVSSSPLFARQSATIANLAIKHRLPAIFIVKHYVEAGGLMSYGVDFAHLMRRSASYVAKILRGANPADLPVEQSAHFEFVVNLKTAKTMGITLPTATLLRADEVIE